jgi:hypothetical protein
MIYESNSGASTSANSLSLGSILATRSRSLEAKTYNINLFNSSTPTISEADDEAEAETSNSVSLTVADVNLTFGKSLPTVCIQIGQLDSTQDKNALLETFFTVKNLKEGRVAFEVIYDKAKHTKQEILAYFGYLVTTLAMVNQGIFAALLVRPLSIWFCPAVFLPAIIGKEKIVTSFNTYTFMHLDEILLELGSDLIHVNKWTAKGTAANLFYAYLTAHFSAMFAGLGVISMNACAKMIREWNSDYESVAQAFENVYWQLLSIIPTLICDAFSAKGVFLGGIQAVKNWLFNLYECFTFKSLDWQEDRFAYEMIRHQFKLRANDESEYVGLLIRILKDEYIEVKDNIVKIPLQYTPNHFDIKKIKKVLQELGVYNQDNSDLKNIVQLHNSRGRVIGTFSTHTTAILIAVLGFTNFYGFGSIAIEALLRAIFRYAPLPADNLQSTWPWYLKVILGVTGAGMLDLMAISALSGVSSKVARLMPEMLSSFWSGLGSCCYSTWSWISSCCYSTLSWISSCCSRAPSTAPQSLQPSSERQDSQLPSIVIEVKEDSKNVEQKDINGSTNKPWYSSDINLLGSGRTVYYVLWAAGICLIGAFPNLYQEFLINGWTWLVLPALFAPALQEEAPCVDIYEDQYIKTKGDNTVMKKRADQGLQAAANQPKVADQKQPEQGWCEWIGSGITSCASALFSCCSSRKPHSGPQYGSLVNTDSTPSSTSSSESKEQQQTWCQWLANCCPG